MAIATKNSETIKVISPLNHIVYLAETLYGTLLGPWFSESSKYVAEAGHSDLLPFYESYFAKKPISQETLIDFNQIQSD